MKPDKTKTKWSIDQAHSKIGFSVEHLMVDQVKGEFKIFNVSITTIALQIPGFNSKPLRWLRVITGVVY